MADLISVGYLNMLKIIIKLKIINTLLIYLSAQNKHFHLILNVYSSWQ